MKRKYRKYSNLKFWCLLSWEQKYTSLRTSSQANTYERNWKHKCQPRHLIYEPVFGSIDVRQFKRTLNNIKYSAKKLKKLNG